MTAARPPRRGRRLTWIALGVAGAHALAFWWLAGRKLFPPSAGPPAFEARRVLGAAGRETAREFTVPSELSPRPGMP